MDAKQLKELTDTLFKDRLTFMQLCQELAENFYPERADFTVRRTHGNEFAADLMTSYPVLTRRDLGDQIGTMLRPSAVKWFKTIPSNGEKPDTEARQWLEHKDDIMRTAMYSRKAHFNRVQKEADQDYSAFGQCVSSIRPSRNADGLIFRNWHISDVVWKLNEEDEMGFIARKWSATARDLVQLFPGKVNETVRQTAEKTPFATVKCYHMIVEADMYAGNAMGRPYWSVYYDDAHDTVLEAVPVWSQEYVISRWQTVSGSQYAYSPASITALPDARLIQSMTYALLEAGEKAVNPPLIATQDAVRSDVSVYAGGITWVDDAYDERLGDALRPITQDLRGLPFGDRMAADSREMIAQAFFLNKLNLPERGVEMTAYEIGQRVQEYIRGAIPIFEPMEIERNGQTCEMTFDILMRLGAFGGADQIPASLKGRDIEFEFQSPLHDTIEQQKGQKFLESKALLAEAADLDQSAVFMLDMPTALRDALTGVGVPAEWMRKKDEVAALLKNAQADQQEAADLERMQQGADVGKTVADTRQVMAQQQ